MSAGGFDPPWLAALQQRASQPPLRPRLPLWFGPAGAAALVGSVEAGFFEQIAGKSSSNGAAVLQKKEHGVLAQDLAALAACMRAAGLAGAWRDELLAVRGEAGQILGGIERGAVRPLGIPTQAVHLAGFAPDGRAWVQQRAANKANDPGLWDTLMGGMVSLDDAQDPSLAAALARETWEEAGLKLDVLRDLRHGGRVSIQRPSADGQGMGYMVEQIDWFTATVPFGLAPVNLDGEVDQFELLDRASLLERLHDGQFTLEASLILAAALGASPAA